MAKKEPLQKPKISYANAGTPILEYADFVRLSSGQNGIVFGFGQQHPHRPGTAITYEVIVPYAVAERLHEILGDQLDRAKKIIEEHGVK